MSAFLDQPFVLAGKRLRNRIVHASMTTFGSRERMVTDRQIQYFANRARGGAAMVVTEPLAMSRLQDSPAKTRVWNDDNLDGLQRWADAVEQHDCRLLGQIQDPGRARHFSGRYLDSHGPSPLPDDLSWSSPRPLSVEAIAQMVEEFAQSSARLQRCGFSGVELSCGHGHLFHQFFAPHSNMRTDRYGGSWENRVRFVQEIVAAVRQACGEEFIIGLKLPGDDGLQGSIGPDEAAIIARLLTASGQVSYVAFAQGTHAHTLHMHVPDRYGPRMPYAGLMKQLRGAIPGVPLMALGRITDPAEAEGLLQRGEAELVGLGRTLIVDPAWPTKARQGRSHEIRYCLSCNTCWGHLTSDHVLACVNNPRVGQPDEVDFWPLPTAAPKRVVVVGAGVAGMEAAWVAAARGHQVTVVSAGSEVGGKARLRAGWPGGEEVSSIYDYQAAMAQKAGVRFRLGVQADAELVRRLEPQAVILAAGAAMSRPAWLPAEAPLPDLIEAMGSVARLSARQAGTALVYDMDGSDDTYAAAERLHALFARVVIVTPRAAVAEECSLVQRQSIYRRLAMKDIETIALHEPVWSDEAFERGTLRLQHVYTGVVQEVRDIAFAAYATPRVRNDALAAPLRAMGLDVRLVGDCQSPRGLLAATAEGHAAGMGV